MTDSSRSRKKVTGALPMAETRVEYARLMRQGISNAEACRMLKINRRTGMRWRHGRTVKKAHKRETIYAPIFKIAPPVISPRYLSEDERVQIADALQFGTSLRGIAVALGRSPSTISREVRRNRSPRSKRYAPRAAQTFANAARKRPRPGKIATSTPLREAIQKLLTEQWSPRQISYQLSKDFPGQPEMQVVHESIYQALYSPQKHGLTREMTRHLRTGRRGRLPRRSSTARRSRFSGPLLDQRPAEVDNRVVPGHWEGDLFCGAFNRSAIATLVERTTGFLLLVHLGGKHDAVTVRERVGTALAALPAHLRKSLTWDQGSEMAEYLQFKEDTTIPVYFCDPHSPWQRGSNENTNGLIRQYFPKGTNLNLHSPEQLAEVAAKINARPRESRNWEPSQTHFDRRKEIAPI
jgi:IS30 family transposase